MNTDIEILKHSFKTIQLVLVEKIRAGSHIQTDRDLVTHCCFTIQTTYLNVETTEDGGLVWLITSVDPNVTMPNCLRYLGLGNHAVTYRKDWKTSRRD